MAAKGVPHIVKLESHVAGVIAITYDTEFSFIDYSITGSESGPKNTIIVPEAVATKLSSLIASSANNFTSYVVKADVVGGAKSVNLEVRLYHPKKGSGAPGVAVKKPWLSVWLPKDALTEDNPLRALNKALDALGFHGVKSTQRATLPLKVKTDLVHVEYQHIRNPDGTR